MTPLRESTRRGVAALAIAAGLACLTGWPVAVRAAQPPSFHDVVASLRSPNADERLRALALLRQAGYPEAEVPVSALLTDPDARVRLAAIATEMNCFLAEKLVPRSRVGLVIEVRHQVSARAAFARGLLAVMPQRLSAKVLSGLLIAASDPDPRVGLEAVYGLGVVGPLAVGPARDEVVRQLGQLVTRMLRSPDAVVRRGALEVLGRVADTYGAGRPAIGETVGDAVVTALNDREAPVRSAAVATLGRLRYERGVEALTARYRYYGHGADAAGALRALARIAYPASLPVFRSALASGDADVRAAAVDGIARTGGAAQVNDMLRRLDGERADLVNLALDFAAARTGRQVTLQPFVAALANPALKRAAAADLLEITATHRADVGTWLTALRAAAGGSRLTLVHIIGLAGSASLIPALQPLTHDANTAVASGARMAIERLRQVPAGVA